MAAKKKRSKVPSKKKPKPKVPLKRTKKKAKKPFKPATKLALKIPPQPEDMTVIEVETAKKLSTKLIIGKGIGKVTEPTDLNTVFGVVTGLRQGMSNYGPWIAFLGEFEVTRSSDGVVMRAPQILLPDGARERLQMDSAGEGVPIEFGFVIRALPSANQHGFEQEVVTVIRPGPHDPLADLRVSFESERGRNEG